MMVGGRSINGVDTEVHADATGMFQIKVDGKVVGSGESLNAAVTQARNTINRDKTVVNVEFVTKTGGERGVATGFHSRNRTIMAKIADGKGEQLEYNYKAFKADIPKAKLNRWFEIQTQLLAIREEQQKIIKEYEITLREVVERAVTEAQSKTLAGVTTRAAARRDSASPTQRRRRY
jgi:hypothetical protein